MAALSDDLDPYHSLLIKSPLNSDRRHIYREKNVPYQWRKGYTSVSSSMSLLIACARFRQSGWCLSLTLSPSSSVYLSLSQFEVVFYENLQKLRGVAVGSYRRLNTGSANPARVLGDHASNSGKFAI